MRGNTPTVRPGKQLPRPLSLPFLTRLQTRETRDRHGLYLAEGVRNLTALAHYGRPVCGLVHVPNPRNPFAQAILRQARQNGVPTLTVTPDKLRQFAQSPDPQGILTLGEQWNTPLPPNPAPNEIWLGLDEVRTPGNVGTLLRSLEAAGGNRVLLLSDRLDLYDPKVIRASMGSIFAHEITRSPASKLKKWPARPFVTFVGATGEAPADYRSLPYDKTTVLLLGHERSGLTPGQRAVCDHPVHIPMSGRLDSLNIAAAGTVVLYEIRNRRHPLPQ